MLLFLVVDGIVFLAITSEEIGQIVGFALGSVDQIDLGPLIDHAQRLGQPAGISQQTLGLFGHIALLQVPDQFSGTVTSALAHGFNDARLGHAAEIIANRWPPAHCHHVETG